VWNSVVEEIYGENEVDGVRIRNLKTDKTEDIAAKAVFVFIGWVPKSDMVKHLVDTDGDGRLIVNELMETKVPGLFAAGDLCVRPLYQLANGRAGGRADAASRERG